MVWQHQFNLSCAESQVTPPLTVAHCKQSGMEVVSQAVASWAVPLGDHGQLQAGH